MAFHRFSSLLLGVLSLFVLSCNRIYDPIPDHVYEVFPLIQGQYRIYKVIDTIYATTQGIEGKEYYRKEVTEGTETDLMNREVSPLYLYDSPTGLFDQDSNRVYQWDFAELWTQYLGEKYAERNEGNIRFLVLKIPPVKGGTWNGNLYNSREADTYEYLNIDTTVTVQGITYEHCVFVLQVPKRVSGTGDPFLQDEYAYEIYAPGIGKIVRYWRYIEKQLGIYEADSRIYFEEIVDHN